jgi:hypothetical protein
MLSRFAGPLTAVLLSLTPAMAETISSAYTALDPGKCRHRVGRDVEDYGQWECRGHAGIPVLMTAGDQRVQVSFGRAAERELAARQTLAAFNSQGKTIEWRIAGAPSHPFAAIMRWNTTRTVEEAASGPAVHRGQVLVVTRLGPGGVCHVGYVDARANPDANTLARRIADQHARAFRCGHDTPIVLGQKGPGFSEPQGPDND